MSCILAQLKPDEQRSIPSSCLTDRQIITLSTYYAQFSNRSPPNQGDMSIKSIFETLPFKKEHVDMYRWIQHDRIDRNTLSYQFFNWLNQNIGDGVGIRLLKDVEMNLVPIRTKRKSLHPEDLMDIMSRVVYHYPNDFNLLAIVTQDYIKAQKAIEAQMVAVLTSDIQFHVMFMHLHDRWYFLMIDTKHRLLQFFNTDHNKKTVLNLNHPLTVMDHLVQSIRHILRTRWDESVHVQHINANFKIKEDSIVQCLKYLISIVLQTDVTKVPTSTFLNRYSRFVKPIRVQVSNDVQFSQFNSMLDTDVRLALYYLINFMKAVGNQELYNFAEEQRKKMRHIANAHKLIPYIYETMQDISKKLGLFQNGWLWIDMLNYIQKDPLTEELLTSKTPMIQLEPMYTSYKQTIPEPSFDELMRLFRELFYTKKYNTLSHDEWFLRMLKKHPNVAVQVVRELFKVAMQAKPDYVTIPQLLMDPKYRYDSWLIRPISHHQIQRIQCLFNHCQDMITAARQLIENTQQTVRAAPQESVLPELTQEIQIPQQYMSSSSVLSTSSSPNAFSVSTAPVAFVTNGTIGQLGQSGQPKLPRACRTNVINVNLIKSTGKTMKLDKDIVNFMKDGEKLLDSGQFFKRGGTLPSLIPIAMVDHIKEQAGPIALPNEYVSAPLIPTEPLVRVVVTKTVDIYTKAILFIDRLVQRMDDPTFWKRGGFKYPCGHDLNAVAVSYISMQNMARQLSLSDAQLSRFWFLTMKACRSLRDSILRLVEKNVEVLDLRPGDQGLQHLFWFLKQSFTPPATQGFEGDFIQLDEEVREIIRIGTGGAKLSV